MKKQSLMRAGVLASLVTALGVGLLAAGGARGDHFNFQFVPDTLVVSRSVYAGNAETVTVGQTLPPGCVPETVTLPVIGGGSTKVSVTCVNAVANGEYPNLNDSNNVWNNAPVDGSFGLTSPIFLDNITTDGRLLDTLDVPTNLVVTSFSSKSEVALNRSADGHSFTFVAYHGGSGFQTAPNQLDVSNSNTPGVVDPTNPVVSQYYRAVVEVDSHGQMMRTDGNAYSGNNGRAAIKASNGFYYMTGNDNNGGLSKTQLLDTQVGLNLVDSTGAELLVPGQTPPGAGSVNMVGQFSITQPSVGYTTADKAGKDTNYRGLTIFDNTLYVTKGSGGNGINTVYQIGNAGTLPTGTTAQLLAEPTTILPGFSTVLASGQALNGTTGNPVSFPFGIWFANADTLYVCDEGDGAIVAPHEVNGQMNVADAASLATAGLQKWRKINGTWTMLYVIQDGLDIGLPYSVANYPASINPATGGCRNLTGKHEGDGTVMLYAITSTISHNGDQGADPNKLMKVRDRVGADSLPASTQSWHGNGLGHFSLLRAAKAGEVLRGVTLAPVDSDRDGDDDHDGNGGRDH